jgi:hypothetical protein
MPVYGQFETVSELGRSGPYAVYRARTADGGWDLTFGDLGSDANYLIKVLHADALPDPQAAADEVRRFLDRVRSQRRIAESGASHWAPVLDAGTTARGDAYYVANLYPRSAASLAHPSAGPIDAPTLHAVVAGILDGLLELRTAHARPHGNLRPGNVLIDPPAHDPRAPEPPLSPDDVRLADPAVEQDATIAGEREDLYNLGEIIHALVLHAKFPGPRALPVGPSPAWSNLGKRGDDWRALCDDLLTPAAGAANATVPRLHDVAARVAGMATSRRVRRRKNARPRSRKLILAAAALAVVAGLGAGEYVHYTRAWRDLCAAHDAWLGPLAARLARGAPPEFTQDPYLRDRVVAPLADARARGIELDPRVIAGAGPSAAHLADHPPRSLGAVWDTERAWHVAGKVAQSVGPQRWTAATELARRRADYETREWPHLLQYAAAAVDRAAVRQGPDWVDALAGVIDANARLAKLDAARYAARGRMDALVARAPVLPALREKIGEFEAFLRPPSYADAAAPTPDAVDALARQLKDADHVAAQFESILPVLADAATLHRTYNYRGWTGAAREVGALIDRAKPTAAPADFAALPAALAATRRTADQVERTWKSIESRQRILKNSGDRILATYGEYLAAAKLADQPDLASLARKLSEIDQDPLWATAARKVSEDEWAKIDVVEFAQKSRVHRQFVGRTVATPNDLSQWIAEVEGRGTQLAAATYAPDAASPNGNGKQPAVESVPRPPTTVTTATQTPATQKSMTAVADAGKLPVTRPSPDAVVGGLKPAAPVTKPSPGAIASNSSTQRTATTLASAQPAPATRRTDVPGVNTPKPAPTTALAAAGATRPTYASAVTPGNTRETAPRTTSRPTTVAVAPKPAPPPPPDPEKVKRDREIQDFIVECREVALRANNRDLKEAWRSRNDQIAKSLEKNPALYTPQLKAERIRLRGRLQQLDGFLTDLHARLPLKPGPAAWNAKLAEALQAAAPTWDDAVKNLTDLALRGQATFETAFGLLASSDQEWRASATKFVEDVNLVDRLLADGYTPDDRTTLNLKLQSTLTAVRTSELYQNDGVRDALQPLISPINVVETEIAPRTLRLLAGQRDQPLGIRLAAWGKTAKDVSKAALEEDLTNAKGLLDAARERLTDKARVDSIKTRLEADLRGRWLALLDTALRADEVEGAIALRDRIPGVDPEQLPPRARANFALHDLRAAVASARGDEAAAEVAPAVKRFRDAVASLDSSLQNLPAITSVVGEINRLGQGAAPDFKLLGPMSDAATRAVRWNVAADEAGDRVTYTGTPAASGPGVSSEPIVLVFRRVRPSAAGRAAWVATNETSVGLFGDVLTASAKWPEFRTKGLLPENDPARGDVRGGPRVWEWPRYGRAFAVTRTWLGAPGFLPARFDDHYPPEIAAEFNRTQIGNPRTREPAAELNPSRRMPMQYVPARAAEYIASIVGCRLPSVDEWAAASKSSEQSVGVSNVRDLTWRLELDHLARRVPGGRRVRPDAGMFVPAGERPSDDVWTSNGAEVNDGVLWFREVASAGHGPPAVFVDLVGNVAEYVTGEAGRVYVIGASAVSPPPRVRDPMKAFEVGRDQMTGGFSDVGFRLAFSEPAVGIDGLRNAVAGNWYLTAK